MSKLKFAIIAVICAISACSSAPPVPELSANTETESFAFKREVFQRGLRRGHSYREPRLLNHVYTMKCVSNDAERPAKRRFNEARSLIEKTEPLVYENIIGEGYQRSFHRNRVNRRVVEQTGCEVASLGWKVTSTDTREILQWAVKKGVLKEAMGQQ
ncbi:hypothetical protein AAFO92_01690 [Roseovarius sp. CAU 1744]|uniref:hypothetical protein n=1 Tax=Roseovarius sp. CAU 1744 TaxID=3140368 RepID=UPI00325A477C